MYKFLCLIIIMAIYCRCTNTAGKQTTANISGEIADVQSNESPIGSIDQDRLRHIRMLFKKYPVIRLPFHYKTQTSLSVTNFSAEDDLDTLVFGEDVPCGIIGVFPDTSQFFGFFYLIAADDALPAIVTFDKQGHLKEKKALATSCWQGCESDCRSLIDIDKNFRITFRYEVFDYEFNEDYSYCGKKPVEAHGYVEYTHINEKGLVVRDQLDSLTFEELMKNPIIHE